MKLNIKNITLVAGVLALAACSNDDRVETPSNEYAIYANIAGLSSRVATSGVSASFENDDVIGVYAVAATGTIGTNNHASNVAYTLSNSGWSSSAGIGFPSDNTTLRFYAYYPQSGDNTVLATAISGSVQTDQSSATNFSNSDFMVTGNTLETSTDSKTVNFTFAHQLALLKVVLSTTESGVDLTTVSNVQVKSVITDFTYDFSAASNNLRIGTTTGDITMLQKSSAATSAEYWAIVPPQSFATSTQLIALTYGGDTYAYTLSSAVTLSANTVQKITLGLNPTSGGTNLIALSNSIVNNWGADDTTGANSNDGEDVDLN